MNSLKAKESQASLSKELFELEKGSCTTPLSNSRSHRPSSTSYQIIPDAPGTGRSQAKLTTDWWQWALSVPDQNPNEDGYQGPFNDPKGDYAGLNQSGPVFFLAGPLFVDPAAPNPGPIERNITVPRGKEIFFPVVNVEWDNAQLQAFFGTDDPTTPENENFFAGLPNNGILSPAELRTLNEACMATTTDMFCVINGDSLFSDADWGDDALINYRQVTPTPKGFNLRIPADNALGLPLEATDNGRGLIKGAMSDGIWVNLKLAPGSHQLTFGGTFNFGSISLDFDGDGLFNSSAKEIAYQKALQQFETFSLNVTNNISQL